MQNIYLFDKAPILKHVESEAPILIGTDAGWATDRSGDIVEDFICPGREASGRWPHGRPHKP